jgi:hypothetical protein
LLEDAAGYVTESQVVAQKNAKAVSLSASVLRCVQISVRYWLLGTWHLRTMEVVRASGITFLVQKNCGRICDIAIVTASSKVGAMNMSKREMMITALESDKTYRIRVNDCKEMDALVAFLQNEIQILKTKHECKDNNLLKDGSVTSVLESKDPVFGGWHSRTFELVAAAPYTFVLRKNGAKLCHVSVATAETKVFEVNEGCCELCIESLQPEASYRLKFSSLNDCFVERANWIAMLRYGCLPVSSAAGLQ